MGSQVEVAAEVIEGTEASQLAAEPESAEAAPVPEQRLMKRKKRQPQAKVDGLKAAGTAAGYAAAGVAAAVVMSALVWPLPLHCIFFLAAVFQFLL